MNMKFAWLGLTLILVSAFILSSCGGGTTTTTSGSVGNSGGTTNTPTSTEPVVVAQLKVGETWRSSDFVVTITEAKVAKSYDYIDPVSKSNTTDTAEAGKTYVIANATIENIGTQVRYEEGQRRFKAGDSAGAYYFYHVYMGEPRMAQFYQFEPGQKTSGYLLFEVPEAATGLKVSYWDDSSPAVLQAEWSLP
jgi:hypothetical protein